MISTIIVFLIIITSIVLVHELGHFFAAKIFGIQVEEFGIGFPPRIIKIKKGKTLFSVNALLLGGFVRMLGEEKEVKRKGSFSTKSIGQRFWVLFSGVLANLLLAFLIFTVGFTFGLPIISSELNHSNAQDITQEIRIIAVKSDSPAQKNGLMVGDVILSINNQQFKNTAELSDFTSKMAGKKVNVLIKRKNQIISKDLTLDKSKSPLGIAPFLINIVRYPWYKAPYIALKEIIGIITQTISALLRTVKNIIFERSVPQEVAGPVGIFFITREVIKLGTSFVFIFIAFISLSLAVINILPFPALDGGRIVFLMIEKFRGKKVSAKIENLIHLVGFILLIILIAFITYFDLIKR